MYNLKRWILWYVNYVNKKISKKETSEHTCGAQSPTHRQDEVREGQGECFLQGLGVQIKCGDETMPLNGLHPV